VYVLYYISLVSQEVSVNLLILLALSSLIVYNEAHIQVILTEPGV
jgi:hypothetical protein